MSEWQKVLRDGSVDTLEKLAESIELGEVEVTHHGPDIEFTGYPVSKGMKAEG